MNKRDVLKYEAIKSDILAQLKKLRPGDKFHSVRELMLRHSVSQSTIDKALSFFYEGRLLEKLPGKGIFVSNALKGKGTRRWLVGLELPDWPSETFHLLLQSLREASPDFDMQIAPMYHRYDDFDFELPSNLDALIWFSTDAFLEDSSRRRLENLRVPIVLACTPEVGISVDYVGCDEIFGGGLAARHLIELGHKSLAVLASESPWKARLRIKGFAQCCKLMGASCRVIDCETQPGELSSQKAYDSISKAVKDGFKETGFFIVSDESAIGAMSAFHENGVSVPRDVSVVSFDGFPCASFYTPPLTSVSASYGPRAVKTLETLRMRLEPSGEAPQRVNIEIEPSLILRKSTGPAPKPARI